MEKTVTKAISETLEVLQKVYIMNQKCANKYNQIMYQIFNKQQHQNQFVRVIVQQNKKQQKIIQKINELEKKTTKHFERNEALFKRQTQNQDMVKQFDKNAPFRNELTPGVYKKDYYQ